MTGNRELRVLPMLLLAGLLTAIVTIVRLIGELSGWDAAWFRSDAGSPGAPFGIIWLVPVFGLLFGRRLAQAGAAPRFVAGFFVPMFGLSAVLLAIVWLDSRAAPDFAAMVPYLLIGASACTLLALFVWPRAFVVLLGYGLIARLPVVAVQYLDIQNGWQTHYGKVHQKLVGLPADERILALTMVQFGLWLPITILLGCGFAAIGAATARRS